MRSGVRNKASSRGLASPQRMATNAAMFWLVHLAPDGLMNGEAMELFDRVMLGDRERGFRFDPRANPLLALVLLQMVYAGALPLDAEALPDARSRARREQVPLDELANHLGLTSWELARILYRMGLSPTDSLKANDVHRVFTALQAHAAGDAVAARRD